MSGGPKASCDAVVVGAGFAGLHAIHRLRSLGFSVQGFEAAPDVGGTWYWNRYPGARCDAQSLLYSFSFDETLETSWTWTERFATQPEILAYLRHVADRFALRADIAFETRVAAARFDEARDLWTVRTAAGQETTCRWLVMASGALSVGRLPDIPGVETFAGESYHTSAWPLEPVDLAGKRVGVIGTGSSGVQTIPMAAETAASLTVFQRTASYVVPALNAPIPQTQTASFRANARDMREKARWGQLRGIGDLFAPWMPPPGRTAFSVSDEEREATYEKCWEVGAAVIMTAFTDVMTDEAANETAASFFHKKIREAVKDPAVAGKLIPRGYPVFSRRLCVGTDYYETYNRQNVTLVDLQAEPIIAISPTGIATAERDYPLDVLIYATGFDALTGALSAIDIRGVGGVSLKDAWADGPRSYLGVAVSGFPNLFTITGPGSPSVLSNVVVSIEQHVEWVAALLDHARRSAVTRIDPDAEAQAAWGQRVLAAAAGTLFMKGRSWYLGANVPGKPQVFMPFVGGVGPYRKICDEIAAAGYPGFVLTSPAADG